MRFSSLMGIHNVDKANQFVVQILIETWAVYRLHKATMHFHTTRVSRMPGYTKQLEIKHINTQHQTYHPAAITLRMDT